jgi:hypothetical protein
MKKNIWLRLLVISVFINAIGAILRISGAGDISTYILWLGMAAFVIAIAGLVIAIFTERKKQI